MGIGAIGVFGEVICLVLASVVISSPLPTDGSWEVTEEWVVKYDAPSAFDRAEDMVVDSSGNVYVSGTTGGLNADITTVAYDPDGNERWIAGHRGPHRWISSNPSMAMGPEGNIYVAGTNTGATGFDFITIAYDSSGNELWAATHDSDNGDDMASAMAVDSRGNVYVTGTAEMGAPFSARWDYATVAYDSSGNRLWVSYYNNQGYYDHALAIAVSPDGYVYVTGESQTPDKKDVHYATIAYDPSGATRWVARYDHSPDKRQNVAKSIALDSEQNVYVTGTCWSSITARTDYVTVVYDRFGSELWVAEYNGPESGDDDARGIALDLNGNVYVTGDGPGGRPQNETTVAYDSSGNELWTASFFPDDWLDYETPRAITVDEKGTVYVMGDIYKTVAYDSDGNELWMATYSDPSGLHCRSRALRLDTEGNVYVTGYCHITKNNEDYVTVKYSQKWRPDMEVDIDPDTLNLGSKGRWITAYIEISGGYGVELINKSTILLNDTIPAEKWPTEIGDYDEDGVPDLMVKFSRSAVQEYIEELNISGGGAGRFGYDVTLTITGMFNDGTAFECSDTIRVLPAKRMGAESSTFHYTGNQRMMIGDSEPISPQTGTRRTPLLLARHF